MKKQDLYILMTICKWIEEGVYKYCESEWSDPTADLAILLNEIKEVIDSRKNQSS